MVDWEVREEAQQHSPLEVIKFYFEAGEENANFVLAKGFMEEGRFKIASSVCIPAKEKWTFVERCIMAAINFGNEMSADVWLQQTSDTEAPIVFRMGSNPFLSDAAASGVLLCVKLSVLMQCIMTMAKICHALKLS